MRVTRRKSSVQIAARLALLAAGVAAAVLVTGASASNSQSYGDATGDADGGADISGLTVSNDDAGNLSFGLSLPNRSSVVSDEAYYIYFSTDAGATYRFYIFGGGGSGLQRLDGSTWNDVSGASVSFSQGLAASVNRSVLGNPGALSLFGATLKNGSISDYAPDSAGSGGRFSYSIQISQPPSSNTTTPPTSTAITTTTTTISTTTTTISTTTTTPTDRDHDGVADTADACPTVPRGRYDSNHNGCPGPFARLHPGFRPHGYASGGNTTFTSFLIIKLAPRTHVVLTGPKIKFSATATTRVSVPALVGHPLRSGATLVVRATAAGRIGYDGRWLVTDHGVFEKQWRCIPPGGRISRKCASVDRGR